MTTHTTFLEIPHLDQQVAEPEIPENEAKDIIDAAISGILTVPMTIDTTYVLDDTSLTYPQEWHYAILVIDVANTVSTELHVPDGKIMKYVIDNKTGFDIVFKTVTGTGITVPTASIYQVYSDGTNVRRIT